MSSKSIYVWCYVFVTYFQEEEEKGGKAFLNIIFMSQMLVGNLRTQLKNRVRSQNQNQ